jgi:DNA-directed RNA polymerase subunit RPC12/RpoP
MRSYCCPVCGAKQKFKLFEHSKVIQPCTECGNSLLVKLENDELHIRVKYSAVTDKNLQPAPTKAS